MAMTSSDSQLVQILKRVERLREEPSDEGVPFVDASPLVPLVPRWLHLSSLSWLTQLTPAPI